MGIDVESWGVTYQHLRPMA